MKLTPPPSWQPYTRTSRAALIATDVLSAVLLFGAPALLFQQTGGTAHQIGVWLDTPDASPPRPLVYAVLAFLVLGVYGLLGEARATIWTRRVFHRWYAWQHPEDMPGADVTAMVKAILAERGPLWPRDIVALLAAGGSWGPAVTVSMFGLMTILRPHGVPAGWLADRKLGEPLALRDQTA